MVLSTERGGMKERQGDRKKRKRAVGREEVREPNRTHAATEKRKGGKDRREENKRKRKEREKESDLLEGKTRAKDKI